MLHLPRVIQAVIRALLPLKDGISLVQASKESLRVADEKTQHAQLELHFPRASQYIKIEKGLGLARWSLPPDLIFRHLESKSYRDLAPQEINLIRAIKRRDLAAIKAMAEENPAKFIQGLLKMNGRRLATDLNSVRMNEQPCCPFQIANDHRNQTGNPVYQAILDFFYELIINPHHQKRAKAHASYAAYEDNYHIFYMVICNQNAILGKALEKIEPLSSSLLGIHAIEHGSVDAFSILMPWLEHSGRALMIRVASQGHVAMAKYILQKITTKSNRINAGWADMASPLIVAVENEDAPMVQFLLQQRVIDVHIRNNEQQSALDIAIARGKVLFVHWLLPKSTYNKEVDLMPRLHHAIGAVAAQDRERPDLRIVNLVIAREKNVNLAESMRSSNIMTALMYATSLALPRVVRQLLHCDKVNIEQLEKNYHGNPKSAFDYLLPEEEEDSKSDKNTDKAKRATAAAWVDGRLLRYIRQCSAEIDLPSWMSGEGCDKQSKLAAAGELQTVWVQARRVDRFPAYTELGRLATTPALRSKKLGSIYSEMRQISFTYGPEKRMAATAAAPAAPVPVSATAAPAPSSRGNLS